MGAAARTPASLWAIQLLLCASLATITFSSSAFLDPEMLQYLDRLYQHAKQLGRPLVNGEMNLLPEKAPSGFANSIRCFSGKVYCAYVLAATLLCRLYHITTPL